MKWKDGIEFEWDETKDLQNLIKHGVQFRLASRVFRDPFRIEYYDETHSLMEDRYITIGLADSVLTVVYTERGRRVRLISARKATKEEREVYYGYCKIYLEKG